jgi:hypothetical protein
MDLHDYRFDNNALLTVTQAAALIRESRQLVNQWRVDNKLKVAGHTKTGVRLYRLGDVLRVEAATRNSVHSTRRPCLARSAPSRRSPAEATRA